MTVKELKEHLSDASDDAIVIVGVRGSGALAENVACVDFKTVGLSVAAIYTSSFTERNGENG